MEDRIEPYRPDLMTSQMVLVLRCEEFRPTVTRSISIFIEPCYAFLRNTSLQTIPASIVAIGPMFERGGTAEPPICRPRMPTRSTWYTIFIRSATLQHPPWTLTSLISSSGRPCVGPIYRLARHGLEHAAEHCPATKVDCRRRDSCLLDRTHFPKRRLLPTNRLASPPSPQGNPSSPSPPTALFLPPHQIYPSSIHS